MRRIFSFLLAVIILIGVCSCSDASDTSVETQPQGGANITEGSDHTESGELNGDGEDNGTDECIHQYGMTVNEPAMPLRDGKGTNTCSLCGDKKEEVIPATKTMKVLAVGNSFSVDAMEYLWDICKDGGMENIVLGNLYVAACSVYKHWTNASNNTGAYKYYKNTDGEWKTFENRTMLSALAEEEWDIITVQQASGLSGQPTYLSSMDKLVNYIKENSKNPDVRIVWHMTWAYQQNSTHSDFKNYNNDQATMYKAIADTVQSTVLPKEYVTGVIPSGTAIQNLRSSYIGDTVTRDGYHMSLSDGRYTPALTWYAYLTGGALEAVDWTPSSYASVAKNIDVIRESVSNALEEPYKVTQSKYVSEAQSTDDDKLALLGLDPKNYHRLEVTYTVGAFRNSTTSSELKTTASNSKYYIALDLLDRSRLPVGSVIIIDGGYQYRPDGWLDSDCTQSAEERPSNVTEATVLVTEEWWGEFAIRCINFSYVGSKTVMTASDIEHIRIYVPNS